MSTPSVVREAVARRLEAFVAHIRTEAAGYGPDAGAFLTSASATLDGGKRLRARFCHAGWSAVAGADATADDTVWDVSAALEIFQSAALVHDDIIDNSDTRRGRPSAHRAFEHDHRTAGWSGDATGFGRSAAVLLGDLLVAWSDDLLEQALRAHPHADAVRAEYARMRRDVTIGQFLDIAEESAWSVNDDSEHADRALRIVSLKSARYSVEQPLLIGAALAGADASQQSALRGFGHPLGLAFQLRDDVLGVFGDESVTGKPSGDDLREGKRTLLIAWTREELAPAARRSIDELVGDANLTNDQIGSLQAIIVESGALERVEDLIAQYAAEADHALEGAKLDADALEELRALAQAATTRTS